ncbi:MAG TPA: hypothetical protein VFG59_16580 [Anaeromyxobacter sp.]|nr:hypothetical protein [Anaeromyxobacter sp.]
MSVYFIVVAQASDPLKYQEYQARVAPIVARTAGDTSPAAVPSAAWDRGPPSGS